MAVDLVFYGQFTASKVGKTGLTVTVDIDSINRSTGAFANVSTGVSATEGRNGVYFYRLSAADLSTFDYQATFKTADTSVDQKNIPALWTYYAAETPTAGIIADSVWDEATAGHAGAGSFGTLVQFISNKIGAFTGSGVNTILGFFQSLARDDASIPSDMGGTFDPALHSLEKIVSDIAGLCNPTNFPAGAVQFTYTITDITSGLPIEGVEVWFSTDNPATNIVWKGDTDTFGIALDVNGQKPRLDAGTYYIWRQKSGYIFNDPDVEVVS